MFTASLALHVTIVFLEFVGNYPAVPLLIITTCPVAGSNLTVVRSGPLQRQSAVIALFLAARCLLTQNCRTNDTSVINVSSSVSPQLCTEAVIVVTRV